MFAARYFLYHERVISGTKMDENKEVPYWGRRTVVSSSRWERGVYRGGGPRGLRYVSTMRARSIAFMIIPKLGSWSRS